eukprot:876324_1
MATCSVKSIFTCWTKFKGGKFELNDDQKWVEYSNQNNIIGTFEQLNGDDYDLNPYEVLLIDRKTNLLIKLDKKYSRKSQVPCGDKNFDIDMMELFKLKWNLIESGFWDSLSDENNVETNNKKE